MSNYTEVELENMLQAEVLPSNILRSLCAYDECGMTLLHRLAVAQYKGTQDNLYKIQLLIEILANHNLLSKALFLQEQFKFSGTFFLFVIKKVQYWWLSATQQYNSVLELLSLIDAVDNAGLVAYAIEFYARERREFALNSTAKLWYQLHKTILFTCAIYKLDRLFIRFLEYTACREVLINDRIFRKKLFDFLFFNTDHSSQHMAVALLNEQYLQVTGMYSMLGKNYLHEACLRELYTFFRFLDEELLIKYLEDKELNDLDLADLAFKLKNTPIIAEINRKIAHSPRSIAYLAKKQLKVA